MIRLKIDEFNKFYVPVGLLFIFLLGTFLRFYGLGVESFSYDEIKTMEIVSNSKFIDLFKLGKPPFQHICEFVWVSLFGYSEISARSLNAIVGSISILLMFVVARQLFNSYIGIISSYFFSVSTFLLYASQTVRYYSFFVFLSLLSVYFYLKILKKNRITDYILFCLTAIISFYNHYFAVLLLLGINLHFLIYWKHHHDHRNSWIICQLLIFISFIPRLFLNIFAISKGKSQVMNWIRMPDIMSPVRTLMHFMGDFYKTDVYGNYSFDVDRNIISLSVLFGVISFSVYHIYKNYIKRTDQPKQSFADSNLGDISSKNVTLVVVWLVTPILLLITISYCFGPVYNDPYASASAPALFILLALIIYRIRNVIPGFIIVGCISILIWPGIINYYKIPQNDQYRDAANFIEQNTGPQDMIVLLGYGKGSRFFWYYRGNAEFCRLETPKGILNRDQLDMCMENLREFWLVTTRAKRGLDDQVIDQIDQMHRYSVTRKINYNKITIYKFSERTLKE